MILSFKLSILFCLSSLCFLNGNKNKYKQLAQNQSELVSGVDHIQMPLE